MSATAPETHFASAEDEVVALRHENRILELKILKLQHELWGRKAERSSDLDPAGQGQLFAEEAAPPPAQAQTAASPAAPRRPKASASGPKPLPAHLPREVIPVADPELTELMCPATCRPMRAGFTESLEVLARRPPEWYVRRYERNVFVSPAKSAPVYSPWPAGVLPRARAHASVVAHIAAQHYGEHQPFHRLEQALARQGVHLPRVTQVSLMEQLDRLVEPLTDALKREVLGSAYLQVDATPVDLCDPARPGQVREATIWSFQAVGADRAAGPVWFEYRQNKSPKGPAEVLAKAGFKGLLQTDGASGLETLGDPGAIRHLGCHAHARRYFFQAAQQGDTRARTYVKHFDRLFDLQRRLRKRSWPEPKPGHPHPHDRAMERFGLPIWHKILALAAQDQGQTLPKSALGKALGYLLGRPELLECCLTTPGARLDNNLVENSVRPIKLGAKNWLFVGHPNAGPRLARLFALVENCRRHGVDAEAYLIDLLQRLEDHPARNVADLLPHRWAKTRAQERAVAAAAAPTA
jgi:transposase